LAYGGLFQASVEWGTSVHGSDAGQMFRVFFIFHRAASTDAFCPAWH
jgi:hypothetical protein